MARDPLSPSMQRLGFLYAVATDDGRVKVGFSGQLRRRLTQLRSCSYTGRPRHLIAFASAKRLEETVLHKKLAPFRARNESGGPNEVYRLTPEVLNIINNAIFGRAA